MIDEAINRYNRSIRWHQSKIKWYEDHIRYIEEKKQRLPGSNQTQLGQDL